MQNNRKILLTIVVVTIVSLAAFGVYHLVQKSQTIGDDAHLIVGNGGEKVFGKRIDAPANTAVKGFPSTLLIYNTGTISESYEIPDKPRDLYSVTFSSDKSILEVFDAYLAYVQTNKYVVVNKGYTKTMGHIYAQKDNLTVNFSAVPGTNGQTKVVIGYVVAKAAQ